MSGEICTVSDQTPMSWCWPSDDCTLHDYATFLSVTSALNITFCIWWNRIYEFIRMRIERSKDERDKELAKTNVVREDDGGRSKCDVFMYWFKQVGRASSALVTVIVVLVLLVFRSNSPMYFWWTASTLFVSPLLMTITFLVQWVWLSIIELADYYFARGVNATKMTARNVPLREREDDL